MSIKNINAKNIFLSLAVSMMGLHEHAEASYGPQSKDSRVTFDSSAYPGEPSFMRRSVSLPNGINKKADPHLSLPENQGAVSETPSYKVQTFNELSSVKNFFYNISTGQSIMIVSCIPGYENPDEMTADVLSWTFFELFLKSLCHLLNEVDVYEITGEYNGHLDRGAIFRGDTQKLNTIWSALAKGYKQESAIFYFGSSRLDSRNKVLARLVNNDGIVEDTFTRMNISTHSPRGDCTSILLNNGEVCYIKFFNPPTLSIYPSRSFDSVVPLSQMEDDHREPLNRSTTPTAVPLSSFPELFLYLSLPRSLPEIHAEVVFPNEV